MILTNLSFFFPEAVHYQLIAIHVMLYLISLCWSLSIDRNTTYLISIVFLKQSQRDWIHAIISLCCSQNLNRCYLTWSLCVVAVWQSWYSVTQYWPIVGGFQLKLIEVFDEINKWIFILIVSSCWYFLTYNCWPAFTLSWSRCWDINS